jgi:hypothetical protein
MVELSRSTGLPHLSKERIIRILGYLNLLDNDESMFDHLPKEILKFIGMKLDCQSLSLFCQISSRFNEFFCETSEMTEMLRNKLQETTSRNLSHYDRRQLNLLCQRKIKDIILSAGGDHSLVVDFQGRVFGFGLNESGQLGLTDQINRTTPNLIGTVDVVAISAGSYHSLILDAKGQVASFGYGGSGRLGLGYTNSRSIPVLIGTSDIIDVSAGGAHSLILNDRGQVFSFGLNKLGQLGIGHIDDHHTPTLINLPKVIAISAGGMYSLFLNSRGQVYSCGENIHGQLGLGDIKKRKTPIEITGIGEIVAISAGEAHSLLLTSRGQVLSFGDNRSGQLGLGKISTKGPKQIGLGQKLKILSPTPINQSEIGVIVAISAGHYHSLILNFQGQVYSFGFNGKGQLGLGDYLDRSAPVSIEISRITAISAGGSHSLISNVQGLIFSFGGNDAGQLGLGDKEERTTPNLIEDLLIL